MRMGLMNIVQRLVFQKLLPWFSIWWTRLTATNRAHVQRLLGTYSSRSINIPRLIDGYNHRMGDVDLADERIEYCSADLRCCRTWFPILIQCLDIIRNNSFIACKYLSSRYTRNDGHKICTVEIIGFIRRCAREQFLRVNNQRCSQTKLALSTIKQHRMSI